MKVPGSTVTRDEVVTGRLDANADYVDVRAEDQSLLVNVLTCVLGSEHGETEARRLVHLETQLAVDADPGHRTSIHHPQAS